MNEGRHGKRCAYLDEMEPDMHLLEGLLIAYRIVREAQDHIEPRAIGALARCSGDVLARIHANWRLANKIAPPAS